MEYLALTEIKNTGSQILEEINESDDLVEILIMLNTLALLKDIGSPSAVAVDRSVLEGKDSRKVIQSRMEYLKE